MSAQAMGWVLDHSTAKGAARLVMLSIANHIDPDGEGWAYVATICREAAVSQDTYLRVTKELVKAGELERDANAGGTMKTKADARPNLFRFPRFAATRPEERGGQIDHPAPERGPQDAPPEPIDDRQDAHPAGSAGCPPIAVPALAEEPTTSVDETSTVFEAWRASTGKTRARLDAKRRRLIAKAIASHGLDDVLAAVVGWRHSAHHRGENDRSTVYNDLGLLLRDAAQIEKFRDLELDAQVGASITARATPIRRDSIMERNRRREAGDACPLCDDTGWVLDSDPVVRCSCSTLAAVP